MPVQRPAWPDFWLMEVTGVKLWLPVAQLHGRASKRAPSIGTQRAPDVLKTTEAVPVCTQRAGLLRCVNQSGPQALPIYGAARRRYAPRK